MELDKRITKIAIIYDCFDCKDARASIGEKGYFSHYYHCFSDLNECRFGVLQDVIDSEHPYDNGKNQSAPSVFWIIFHSSRRVLCKSHKTRPRAPAWKNNIPETVHSPCQTAFQTGTPSQHLRLTIQCPNPWPC